MQMHEAQELLEVSSLEEANFNLNAGEGWKLLAVVSGQEYQGSRQRPYYILGKAAADMLSHAKNTKAEGVPLSSERHDSPRR